MRSNSPSNIASVKNAELRPVHLLSRGGSFRSLFIDLLSGRSKKLLSDELSSPILSIEALDIQPGDRIHLTGGNGSGKSSLCRLLSGNYTPSSGEVIPSRKTALVTPDASGLFWELSLRENIELFVQILKLSEPGQIRSVTDGILEWSELNTHSHRPIKELSQGMMVRFWLTLMTVPRDVDLLLIDEIHRAQDQVFTDKLWDRIRALIQRSRASIYVSHRPSDSERLSFNRVISLEKGRVASDVRLQDKQHN